MARAEERAGRKSEEEKPRKELEGPGVRSMAGLLDLRRRRTEKKWVRLGKRLAIFSLGQRGGITLCEAWWEELALGFWT